MPDPNDFYEDDEPVEQVRAAFEAGQQGVTADPSATYDAFVCPEAANHGNPFRYCPVKGCGWIEPSEPKPDPKAEGIAEGYLMGLRTARGVVEKQTDLTELVHFDRPSDFRKGVLTCLAALDHAIKDATDA